MTAFLLLGCHASGAMSAVLLRALPNMPETCTSGVWRAVSIMAASGDLPLFSKKNWNRRGCFCLTSFASAMVAYTSESASWAWACSMPLAAVSFSKRNTGKPFSSRGHSMPSGRRAWQARTTSSKSQRELLF